MNRLPIVAAALTAFVACAQTAPDTPSANEMLAMVRAQLPQDPLVIKGDVVVRRRKGVIVKRLAFEASLDFGGRPSAISYTIMDPEGATLERLAITRDNAGRATYRYIAGDGPAESKTDLFRPVQETDMSWTDLTLSFLWWPDGRVVGTDTFKGRECFVMEIEPPHDVSKTESGNPGSPRRPYALAKLWIDRQMYMILRAEEYDENRKLLRELWIRSLKKMNEQWMIKEMEVAGHPAVQRTRLIVRSLDAQTTHDVDLHN